MTTPNNTVTGLAAALSKVRARAEEPGTLQAHGPKFAKGMRCAANMIERKCAAALTSPAPSAPDRDFTMERGLDGKETGYALFTPSVSPAVAGDAGELPELPKITRYDVVGDIAYPIHEAEFGSLVDYDDHAAAMRAYGEQCRRLATAEQPDLRDSLRQIVGLTEKMDPASCEDCYSAACIANGALARSAAPMDKVPGCGDCAYNGRYLCDTHGEQPGSAVQGEAVGYITKAAADVLRAAFTKQRAILHLDVTVFADKPPCEYSPIYLTTPPPAPDAEPFVDGNGVIRSGILPDAPAAEQGDTWHGFRFVRDDSIPVGEASIRQGAREVGRIVGIQPEARGVEGMVPAISPNGSDDDMLAYLDKLLTVQGQLMFARENYDEEAAETFGVAILDFMRLYGMRLRAKLAAAPSGVRVDVSEAFSAIRRAAARTPHRDDRLSLYAAHAALTAALAGKDGA